MTIKRSKVLALSLLMSALGCAPTGNIRATGDPNVAAELTSSSTPGGTNANQEFVLGSENAADAPLVFDWQCTDVLHTCGYTLTIAYGVNGADDDTAQVEDWVNQSFAQQAGGEIQLRGGSVQVEAGGNNVGLGQIGLYDCTSDGNIWTCSTASWPTQVAGLVPPGTAASVEVTYDVAFEGEVQQPASAEFPALSYTMSLDWASLPLGE
jgi:hypothetical protein